MFRTIAAITGLALSISTVPLIAYAADDKPADAAAPKNPVTGNAELQARRESGFVEVPGGPVWYEIYRGEGVPVLALHGGPGGTSCGLQVLAPLSDERSVIRYDQLGTGRSGRPDDTSLWDKDRFVTELDAVRTKLGLEKIHLYGHSWGGALAAYYFLETGGDGVESLILSSPLLSTPRWIEDANLLRAELPEDVRAALDEGERTNSLDSDAYQKATDEFYARHVSRGDPVEVYECKDAPGNNLIYQQMWGATEFNASGNLLDFDVTPRLGEIDVPTLFIAGEFDEARPETQQEFAKMIEGAEVVVIPGVGHSSATRAPEEYRAVMREFLNKVDAASKTEGEKAEPAPAN